MAMLGGGRANRRAAASHRALERECEFALDGNMRSSVIKPRILDFLGWIDAPEPHANFDLSYAAFRPLVCPTALIRSFCNANMGFQLDVFRHLQEV